LASLNDDLGVHGQVLRHPLAEREDVERHARHARDEQGHRAGQHGQQRELPADRDVPEQTHDDRPVIAFVCHPSPEPAPRRRLGHGS
jgi:hypothetical protein